MADQSDHSHSVTQKLAKRSSPVHHHKETHGRSNDIDEDTPVTHVKGPNTFERVKEEVEAIVQRVHSKKEEEKKAKVKGDTSFQHDHRRHHHHHHHHHKETHGGRDDIDESTSMDEVKGPNVFQRVKEEVEAIVETIHPKKGSDGHK